MLGKAICACRVRAVKMARTGRFICGFIVLIGVALVATPYASADQLTINPSAPCGGAVTCDGDSAFSLTTTSLNSANLPSFGGTPVQFLITNNTGSTIDTLTFTIDVTLPAGTPFELWNANTSGFNASTNPFTLATIDGFNALNGTSCTGGGVFFGSPSGSPRCIGGLPATIVWSIGGGNGIAPGQSFLLEDNSPTAGTLVSQAPEPSSFALLLTGLLAFGSLLLSRKST